MKWGGVQYPANWTYPLFVFLFVFSVLESCENSKSVV
jgi:hypothetical protein